MANLSRNQARKNKHFRLRHYLKGTTLRPRLNVFKSLQNFEAQLIDDTKNHTIAFVSTKSLGLKNGGNIAAAKEVGAAMGEKIKSLGITTIVFDRGGYIYHGKIKAFADAVRDKGVNF